jgi:hypothetical protein
MAPPQRAAAIASASRDAFVSVNNVYYGAALSTKKGTAFATIDDSYDSIAPTISSAFGSTLTVGQLAWLTKAANNDLTANAFASGEVEGDAPFNNLLPIAAVIGLTPSTVDPTTYNASYTKGEPAAGRSIYFKIPVGTTVSAVVVAAPALGKSVTLGKFDTQALNYRYLQAPTDPAEYKEFAINAADYDEWTGFKGQQKTITIATGVENIPVVTAG